MPEDLDSQTALMQQNMKAQKDASDALYRQKSRFEALRYAPTRKADAATKVGIDLTATELINEAEIIYQWLIKDL